MEETKNEVENVELLRHYTTFNSLYGIIISNKLLNPLKIEEINENFRSSAKDKNSIFFTPLFTEKFINDKDQTDPVFYLDLQETLNKYPEYYINSGNSFQPLTGKYPKRRGIEVQNCDCLETYHNLNPDNSNKFNYLENPSEKPCYRTKEELLGKIKNFQLSVDSFDEIMDNCDGGPELAIFSPEIDLSGLLKYLVVPNREFIKTKYINNERFRQALVFINNIEGDTIETKIDNFYELCKNIVETTDGGQFIELTRTSNILGGKSNKSKKKSNKSKKKSNKSKKKSKKKSNKSKKKSNKSKKKSNKSP